MSEETKVASNFYTLNYDLGNGRQIQINGSFYEGETREMKCAKLDETVDIVERERARLAIELLEAREKQSLKGLSDHLDRMNELQGQLSRSAGKDKATSLKGQIGVLETNIKQFRESIEEGRKEIAMKRKFVETGVMDAA